MFKILLVNQVWYHEDDAQIEVKEVSLAELLENSDYEIQAQLEMLGWKNAKKIADREAQLVLNKNFYVVDPCFRVLSSVDLDKLQNYHLTSLAGGSKLLQEVAVKSALSDAQYKQYQKAKKVIDGEKAKQTAVNRKRAEKKKAKELAKAAKILEDNGIKVGLVPEE